MDVDTTFVEEVGPKDNVLAANFVNDKGLVNFSAAVSRGLIPFGNNDGLSRPR